MYVCGLGTDEIADVTAISWCAVWKILCKWRKTCTVDATFLSGRTRILDYEDIMVGLNFFVALLQDANGCGQYLEAVIE